MCEWHVSHEEAFEDLNRRLEQGGKLVAAAPALLETYSVLTRLPAPHRISPTDAFALLEANFGPRAPVVSPTTEDHWDVLRNLRDRVLGGGVSYDALILRCAQSAGVNELITLNPRDFNRLGPGAVRIVCPVRARS